jgi:tRNA (guanine-N7-)-methyltransferase
METFLGDTMAKTGVEIRKNEALEVTSKYEARWLRQEKDIYDVYVKCKETSEEKHIVLDFNFNTYSLKVISALNKFALNL